MHRNRPLAVLIRPFSASDGASVQILAADARVAKTCGVRHPLPDGSGDAFVERALAAFADGGWYAHAICEGDCFAGIVGLDSLNPARSSANLFYWLGVPFWGRGIATEAARHCIEFAVGIGLQSLDARCLADHAASMRVLEKNDFTQCMQHAYQEPWQSESHGSRFLAYTRRLGVTAQSAP